MIFMHSHSRGLPIREEGPAPKASSMPSKLGTKRQMRNIRADESGYAHSRRTVSRTGDSSPTLVSARRARPDLESDMLICNPVLGPAKAGFACNEEVRRLNAVAFIADRAVFRRGRRRGP
jgi:hypothetical protein